ncbi:MAG: portal protein [Marinifilaceae bacterium]
MEDEKAKGFLKRFNAAKAVRDEWESLLRETYDLFLPDRQGFDCSQRGQSNNIELYTDEGVRALAKFANNIKTKLMPSGQRWAKLEPSGNFKVDMLRGGISKEEEEKVQQGLDIDTEVLFYHLWSSNFDQAANESMQDMAVSVGAFMIQDTGREDSPLNFVAVPADQLSIEEAGDGVIRSAWREWTIKAREIDGMWQDREPDDKLDKLISDKPECDVKVIEGTVYNPSDDNYTYSVHVKQSEKKIIFSTDYEVSPWVIFRWSKSPQETWGRGVAMNCKHTMAMFNQEEKDVASARAKEIDPVAVIDTSAIVNPHKVSFNAGARILKNPEWNGSSVQSKAVELLASGTNFQIAQNSRENYKSALKEAFYLLDLPPMDAGAKTATEYQVRVNEALEQKNAAFTRLNKELIEQTIARVYYILSRYNIVTPYKSNGKVMGVKSTAPLAGYQDAKDIETVQKFISDTIAIFGEELGAEIVRKEIDIDKYGDYVADRMSIPIDIRLTVEKKKKVDQQVKDEKQAQQQSLLAEQAANQLPPPQVPPEL